MLLGYKENKYAVLKYHFEENKHSLMIYNSISIFADKWAMTWENLFMPYANNKGADQPVHPCSLISAFVVSGLDSIIPLVSTSEISSLYLASVAA